MKRFNFHHLLLILAVFISLPGAVARRADTATDARKADYVFLQAASLRDENLGDYYMMLRHARRISPDDPYIAGAIAEIEIFLPSTDSVSQEKAYSDLARRFKGEPTVQRYANAYGEAASRAGRIDDLISMLKMQDSLMPDRTDPAVQLAKTYVQRFRMNGDSTDLKTALNIYNRIEKAIGPTEQLTMNKIEVYSTVNDSASMLAEAEHFKKNAPDNFRNNFVSAAMFYTLGRTEKALELLDRAEQLNPESGEVNLYRSYIYRDLGDSARYDAAVFGALEAENINIEGKIELLSDYVIKLSNDSSQRGRIDTLFAVVEELHPGEAQLHELHSSYNESTGRYKDAAEQLSYSVALDPNNQRLRRDLTALYIDANDTESALESALAGIRRFPYAGYFPLVASALLIMEERDSAAIALLDTVPVDFLENDKIRSRILAQKGDILWRFKESAKAIDSYSKAIEYDNENYMAMNNMAYFLALEKRDLDKAEIYAAIAATAQSSNPTFLDTYAWVLFTKKDYPKALIYIEKALESSDAESDADLTSDVYDHAGDIYFMNGRPDDALKYWKKAAELDPDNKAIQKKIKHKAYFFD